MTGGGGVYRRGGKRLLDLAIAVPAAVLLLPVSAAVALAVRGTLGRPVLFRQRRPGLAEKSFVFENTYVTQPVCTPARASIMTGLYPHATGLQRNNIPLSRDIPTIGDMISGDY